MSGSSDMAVLDHAEDVSGASVGEEFTSQMKLGDVEGVLESFSGGSGVRSMAVWGAMQPLRGDEGVGSRIGRQVTVRMSGEQKPRAVSKGAVEVVGMEGVEGDLLERVEKLRQRLSL